MQDETAHGGRADRLHLARRGRRRHDARRVQGAQQLPQEQGVAAGGAYDTRGRTPRPPPRPGAPAPEPPRLTRSAVADTARPASGRDATCAHSDPRRRSRIRWASSEQHRDRKPLDPLRQVGQEPQRVAIDPLAVVDRARAAERGRRDSHQPVEAVQGLEAGIASGDCRSSGSNKRAAGAAAPANRSASPGRLADHGLQQLAHDAERKRLLELRAPRLERPHARLPAAARASRASSVLPAPAGPSIRSSVPSPAHAPIKASRSVSKLALALEQTRPSRTARRRRYTAPITSQG